MQAQIVAFEMQKVDDYLRLVMRRRSPSARLPANTTASLPMSASSAVRPRTPSQSLRTESAKSTPRRVQSWTHSLACRASMSQPSRLTFVLPVGVGRRATSLGSHGRPTGRNRCFDPKTVSSPLPPLHRPILKAHSGSTFAVPERCWKPRRPPNPTVRASQNNGGADYAALPRKPLIVWTRSNTLAASGLSGGYTAMMAG